jgi:Holliday junction resolvase RusA-like endonuclease
MREAAAKYWDYASRIREKNMSIPEAGMWAIFVLPMPPSWPKSKRNKLRNKPHKQTPDGDNLMKAILDAVFSKHSNNPNIPKTDAHVWDARYSKIWGERGRIIHVLESPPLIKIHGVLRAIREKEKKEEKLAYYAEYLESRKCQCGETKITGRALCTFCTKKVPVHLTQGLWKELGDGFEEAFEEACRWLNFQI